MSHRKVIRDVLRFIYLIIAPVAIWTAMLAVSSLMMPLLHPKDPLREKITTSARHFETLHPWFKSDPHSLTLFNGYLIIASKPISKGKIIEANSLERALWSSQSGPGMELSGQTVVHSVAAHDIVRDQLITTADLMPPVASKSNEANLDAKIKTASEETHMPKIWDASAFIILGVGVCLWAYGAALLHILAFRKSLAWGLSSVFLPFATAFIELRNWSHSLKFFHLTLIGCALMSLATAMLIVDVTVPLCL